MAAGSGLSFRGVGAVMKAYDYKSTELWSVFDGKNLMHKGTGGDELREFLTMLAEGGSSALYTLKVYEDLDDSKKIKSTTPDDGSFRFKLIELDADPGYTYRTNSLGSVNDNLRLLNERLDRLEGPDDDTDETFSESVDTAVKKAVIGAIENPEKIGVFIDAVKQILGVSVPRPAIGNISRAGFGGAVQTEKLGGMGNDYEQSQASESAEERVNRLATAIDILERADPKIVDHLEKLAAVARADPKKFNSLIAMLGLL